MISLNASQYSLHSARAGVMDAPPLNTASGASPSPTRAQPSDNHRLPPIERPFSRAAFYQLQKAPTPQIKARDLFSILTQLLIFNCVDSQAAASRPYVGQYIAAPLHSRLNHETARLQVSDASASKRSATSLCDPVTYVGR